MRILSDTMRSRDVGAREKRHEYAAGNPNKTDKGLHLRPLLQGNFQLRVFDGCSTIM